MEFRGICLGTIRTMMPPNELSEALLIPRLVTQYYTLRPNPAVPAERVAFGTSGHRGTSAEATFNEDHILAIAQAVADYRISRGIAGPVFLASDTHALSEPAFITALEVLVANGLHVFVHGAPVPTPVLSFAVRAYNAAHEVQADGIVITPSHNPPVDGGLKYNPPHGGPAETAVTQWIEERANALLANGNDRVKRQSVRSVLASEQVQHIDMLKGYIAALPTVVDIDAIRGSGIRVGVDPLGGASLEVWDRVAAHYKLDITVVQRAVDPAFGFMPRDYDGAIRMDCSSAAAMAGLLAYQHDYDVAVGNDPDADRHGIVTPAGGLINPNHYYAVALAYAVTNRTWPAGWQLGRTVVTSMLLDRIAADYGAGVYEVPVGFKWFVEGLANQTIGLAVEESAGASLLTREGATWTTDKDGIAMGLLAAEITAVNEEDVAVQYGDLTEEYGASYPLRNDVPATPEMKAAIIAADPAKFAVTHVAGNPVTKVYNTASGEKIGGLKVVTNEGWFAVRPSGTEALYKVYAESLHSEEHAQELLQAGEDVVQQLLA